MKILKVEVREGEAANADWILLSYVALVLNARSLVVEEHMATKMESKALEHTGALRDDK